MKSVMKHLFSQIPQANIQRSIMDRSSGYKTTFDSGYLIPFFWDEVLPGDSFRLKTSLFARLATPAVPFMDNLFLDTQYFFVPSRLLWSNFQRFMGEQDDPDDSIDYLVPVINSGESGVAVGSIYDYFGIPTGVANLEFSALPFRAYNLIWNEWYRDENLQDSVPKNMTDGPDSLSDYSILRRGKRHDYFTSCLPWPQKGAGVELPLSGNAPVYGIDGTAMGLSKESSSTYGSGFHMITTDTSLLISGGSGNRDVNIVSKGLEGRPSNVYADLSEVTAATINSLRTAFQMQKFLEKCARGGTRYTEILRAHFGVVSPDARLQRPEYLGGASTRIHINPVAQTASSDAVSPQGNLAAFGVSGSTHHGFNKGFVEHGYIIGLLSVRADLTYQQGLNRLLSHRTRYDYYWPSFAHLGEQAVLNKEIYAQGGSVKDEDLNVIDDKVFGYQERYAEYRYRPSYITGKFRSSYAQSLDVWHLSQYFSNLPVLNDEFIVDNPPVSRVVAVQDEPQFLLDAYFDLKCTRPMPLYGVPGLVDHF